MQSNVSVIFILMIAFKQLFMLMFLYGFPVGSAMNLLYRLPKKVLHLLPDTGHKYGEQPGGRTFDIAYSHKHLKL